MVGLLLARGAAVDARIAGGWRAGRTPLMLAAEAGQEATIRCLLEAGADIHAADGQGWQVIHSAASGGLSWFVELLLDRGIDPNVAAAKKLTPPHCAARKGHSGLVRLLRARGARAQESPELLFSSGQGGLVELVEELLAADKRLAQCRNDERQTPLHFAADQGQIHVTRLLLAHGADVEASSSRKERPLHLAASRGYEPMVRLLLDHGATVNPRSEGGWTPLRTAIFHWHGPIGRLLIERRADSLRKFPLKDHYPGGCPYEQEAPIIVHAARNGDADVFELLVARGASLQWQSRRDGQTLLHNAARGGATKIIDCLLEHGAAKDVRTKSLKQTPLQLALQVGHVEAAAELRLLKRRATSLSEQLSAKIRKFRRKHAYLDEECGRCGRGTLVRDFAMTTHGNANTPATDIDREVYLHCGSCGHTKVLSY
ncbi:MAG: ankyrin repeat domain-containing protein [Candidatus Schekmanbacteria bacterium]|nr:ankyrin repeat domain-containing protein [Candidatus Schekmanbacteria bacterium]